MKKTKTTGQTCIGDLRLSPIDIGFDPRITGHPIQIPEHFASVGIEVDGDTYIIEGTRDEMIREMVGAGYKIAQ